jgi:hypothetical protein
MTPVLLAFIAGMLAGSGITVGVLLWISSGRPAEPDPPADWPRLYAGCDRCMSLRYRSTPEALTIHQDRAHVRVLRQGPSGW